MGLFLHLLRRDELSLEDFRADAKIGVRSNRLGGYIIRSRLINTNMVGVAKQRNYIILIRPPTFIICNLPETVHRKNCDNERLNQPQTPNSHFPL